MFLTVLIYYFKFTCYIDSMNNTRSKLHPDLLENIRYVAEHIVELRRDAGLSLKDLSDRSGVAIDRIRQIERSEGCSTITICDIHQLLSALDTSMEIRLFAARRAPSLNNG